MPKPKIQLALDTISLQDALLIAEELQDYWDVLEIGTSLLLKEGLHCVPVFRQKYPDAVILADTKIIDSGRLLTETACKAGADIVSVVSAASRKTIMDCIDSAHALDCRVILDHLSTDWVNADLIIKAAYGADIVGLHIPKDLQGETVMHGDVINAIKDQVDAQICVAGGINPEIIQRFNTFPIDIFVVGGYLLNAKDRVEHAVRLNKAMKD